MVPPEKKRTSHAARGPEPPPVEDDPSVPVGPATCLLVLTTGRAGEIKYQMASYQPRAFTLGRAFSSARIGIIDTLRVIWVFDLRTNDLVALCAYVGTDPRVILFGRNWGTWIDEFGKTRTIPNPFELLQSLRLAADIDDRQRRINFEININILFREAFSPGARAVFRGDMFHHFLELCIALPTGQFEGCKVLISDGKGQGSRWAIPVSDFPFQWLSARIMEQSRADVPESVGDSGPQSRPPRRPPAGGPAPTPEPESESGTFDGSRTQRLKLKPRAASPPPQSRPSATESATSREPSTPPPRVSPFRVASGVAGGAAPGASPDPHARRPPATPPPSGMDGRHLRAAGRPSISAPPPVAGSSGGAARPGRPRIPFDQVPLDELMEEIAGEATSQGRWRMIEPNLVNGKPDRIYPLIMRFLDVFVEFTPGWSPARLRSAFGWLPGGVLTTIMHDWFVNQVLTLADENAEKEKILDWLRERELERLLELTIGKTPHNVETARRDLCLDRSADAKAIKKVWRTLLGFLNADLGRQEERPIHKKKDEIAKRLQVARDLLMKSAGD